MSKQAQAPKKVYRVYHTYHGPDRAYHYSEVTDAATPEEALGNVERIMKQDGTPMDRIVFGHVEEIGSSVEQDIFA